VSLSWRLTPAQTDQIWQSLGLGDHPFPIQVRSHGRDDAERTVIRRQVRDELRARSLLSASDRLDPELETALRMLAKATTWIDSVWFPDEETESPMRALALAAGHVGLLATQLSGPTEHDGGDLLLRAIHPSGLVSAILSELPPAPPGRRPAATAAITEFGQQQPGGDEFGTVMIPSRPTVGPLDAFHDILAAPHPRAGQISANARDGRGRGLRSNAPRWCDNSVPTSRPRSAQ
jgi:ESX secretion-associated protein EspG